MASSSQGQTQILEPTLPIFGIYISKVFFVFFNGTPQPLNVTPRIKNMFDVIFGLYFDMAAADDCLHATSMRWI